MSTLYRVHASVVVSYLACFGPGPPPDVVGEGAALSIWGACSNTALGCLRSAPGAPRGSGTPGGFQARLWQGHQARVGQGHPHAQDARL